MLITQGKTNWKFLLIVVVLAAIVGGGILWCNLKQAPASINPVTEYLEGAELQYENESQKENISIALNNILDLSEEELKERRYKDYTGRENQWDLPTLIYRYFIPRAPGTTLGDNFFSDVKSEEVQEQVGQILEKYFKETEGSELFEIRQYAKKLCEEVEGRENLSAFPPSFGGPLPKMTIETIISGNFSSPDAEEFFVSCQDLTDPPLFGASRRGEHYFYIIDSTGNILIETRGGRGRYSSLPFQVIDINDDGSLEIVWGYGIPSGQGTLVNTYTYIYSLKYQELFEMIHSEEWQWGEKDVKIFIGEETTFSENLENPEFQPFKDYLSSSPIAYYEWYNTHGEYEWYEIDGEIFYLQERACLAKGTKVTMLDGSYKNIEDIKEGDIIKSLNLETKELKDSQVIKIIKRKDPIVNINNELKAAPEEVVYLIDKSTKKAIELKTGDILFDEKIVNSVEYSADLVDTYDLILEDADNFFAEGYLVRTPNF